ncbi:UNVERIFIED_CONTAM: hypothetical protein Sradi_3551500 [Sesamum radiatum]|uniref:Trigger factor ribosome-binding bacterial domain-containing protein n=1 Tax=Sesamum radiatum TaxID=300843 RepID=A0AAW2QFG8_SESRA
MPFLMGQNVALCSLPKDVKLDTAALCINHSSRTKFTCSRSLIYCSSSKAGTRLLLKPISAVGSGLEASIADKKDNAISIKDFEIVVESKGDDKMQITVEVSGFKTQEIYDEVFSKMVDDAQPIPGFRRVKGVFTGSIFMLLTYSMVCIGVSLLCYELKLSGKTPNIPKDILLEILGPSKVYEQVIRKIINSAIAECVAKEGLTISEDLQIGQSLEDLEASFEPGSNFKFDATVQCLNKS